MRIKKRRKSSRYRASQTARRGKAHRTRGSGNQGGKGMSGTGKRGDQKKTLVINLTGGNNYFGKDKALRKPKIVRLQVINLSDVELRAHSLQDKNGVINLEGYKILGSGDIKTKLNIKASAASKSALDKVKEVGGEITLKYAVVEEKPKSAKK